MTLKFPLCFLALIISIGLSAQATLNVDGYARFENSLSIGSNNLGVELEINDSDNNTAMIIDFNTATRGFITGLNVSSGNFFGTTTNDRYSFITDDVVRMILSSGGFIGIGTPGPSERLHVRDDGDIGSNTTIMVLESTTSKIPTLKFDEGGDFGMGIQYDGTGQGVNNKMHILNTITNKAFTITNGGLIGVKEPNPEEALEVDGSFVIDVDDSENELLFYDGSTAEGRLAYDGQVLTLENDGFGGKIETIGQADAEIEGSGDILLDGEDTLLFFTDVSTKGFLSNAGRFGINTTGPSGMLHVRAFGNAGVALRMENDNNNNHWSWRAKDDLLELHYNGVVRGLYNGNTGQYTVVSDQRLKENITAITDGVLEGINKLEPSEYYFKSNVNRDEKSIGFIAQDVLEVFPVLVNEPETPEGFYSINYGSVSVLAIKALQEQQEELDWMQKEIEAKRLLKEKLESYKLLAENIKQEIAALESNEVKE